MSYTQEVENILESVSSIVVEVSSPSSGDEKIGVPMRLPTRIRHLDSMMARMASMTRTREANRIFQLYKHVETVAEKSALAQEMVTEFTKRLRRYGQGGPELSLVNAAYRYFRHKYDEDDGLDGSWLQHEAFSIQKLMERKEIPADERYALFTALFQSGKTFLAIDLTIIYLTLDMTPIIVVPKSADVRQLLGRMRKVMDEFVAAMKRQGFSDEALSIYDEILYHSSTEKLDDISKFNQAISRERNRCIVVMKHHTQIERLLDLDPDSRIVLFIDEAHNSGGYKRINVEDGDQLHDENVKYDRAIVALKAEAAVSGKVILQTATAANIMVSEWQLWADCIFQKRHGPWYRGPAQIEYQLIGTKNADEELMKALVQLSGQEPWERTVYRDGGRKDKHPIYLLAHTARSVDHMKSILQAFHNDNPIVPSEVINSDWLVMTFQGEGLRVWHKSLMGQRIEIADVVSQDHGSGEHLLAGVEPFEMMDWCEANGGVERFPRRVVLSYDMGEEGITFGNMNIHLTHLLLFGNTTSARTAQIVNRLSGNHGDNHPLVAMVSNSNKNKSIKEFLAHDEWVKELSHLKQFGNFQVARYLTEKEHLEGHMPKKFISIKNAKNLLKECPNPNLKEEKKAMRKTHAAEICIAFDREKFDEDYKAMVAEKTEMRRVLRGRKYIVIDQNIFDRNTDVYKTITEVEKIIIDEDKIDQAVPVVDLNRILVKLPMWKEKTTNHIHGAVWTQIRLNARLAHTDNIPTNSLVYWRDGARAFVRMTQ
jgi:hypothetical protein